MYYTLEQAANVLKITPGELNRMREKGLLRAFKDGNTWKFRKDDIDNYLANQIKSRSDSSTSLGTAESDLLSDTDDEAVTQTADTNSFESLVSNIPISARNNGDDKDVVLVGDNSASDNDDDLSFEDAADSGISLLDEDEDIVHTTSDSGISLDDDMVLSGSNVDLGGMSDADDFILGSGSGMNLAGDSGVSLDDGSDQVNVAGASGISLMEDDDDIFTTSTDEEPTRVQGAPVNLDKGASQEVEELRLVDDDQPEELTLSDSPQSNDDQQEEFQLATSPSDDESDSESSSQIIPLADDNSESVAGDEDPFVTITSDETDAGVYGLAGGENDPSPQPAAENAQSSEAESAGLDGAFGSDFTDSGFAETGTSTGFGEDIGGDGFVDSFDSADSGGADFGAGGGDGGFGGLPPVEPPDTTVPGDIGAEPVRDFTQPTPVAPVVADAEYSTMSVWLGLIPCLLLLCLAGIGVYELIRTMWSWSQPFALTGTVLETVGNLLKLT